ncbi:peptidoglycan-binding domain-containing protein [Streptomyces sp. NPDC088846]|uniref:peptidoglycan-binding domain-containing protein n=1 Tax=Streptomyces sp. NPDC088846 TaxID=3365908 RepID=UPI0037F7FB0F
MYTVTADGAFGQRTADAMKAVQKCYGPKPTGSSAVVQRSRSGRRTPTGQRRSGVRLSPADKLVLKGRGIGVLASQPASQPASSHAATIARSAGAAARLVEGGIAAYKDSHVP